MATMMKKAPGAGKASKANSNGSMKSSSKTVKRVYFFGNGKAEGGATMKDLLGG